MKRIICAVLLCALMLSGCAKTGASVPTSDSTVVSESSVESVSSSEESVTNESSEEALSAEESSETEYVPAGIPGSNCVDITLSLEQRGFPDHEGGSTYVAATREVAEGITLDYSLAINNGKQIVSGTFNATVMADASHEDIAAVAESYLSFCASFPYDGNDANAAQSFVIDNITSSDSATTQIGDVAFELYTTPLVVGEMISLSIKYNPAE